MRLMTFPSILLVVIAQSDEAGRLAGVFTVGGSGRLTTWTGVLTDSFLTGGPKVGRHLFIANPAI